MQEDVNKSWAQAFDQAIHEYINDSIHYIIDSGKNEPKDWATHLLDTDDDFQDEFNNVVSHPDVKEADELFTTEVMGDPYVNMELALPQGDTLEPWYARVTKRLRDANGIPIGTAHDNPILDTRMYEVEFMDREKSSLSANYIAENLFAQIDDEGNHQVLSNEIIDHRTTGRQVMQQDVFIMAKNGVRQPKETATGWEILVQWKDGSTNWVALKDMKESYPVQVAEYAIASRISMEPAFAWWVPRVLKKRNRIISKVKSKYWLRTHKFGIRIPKTIEEACRLDRENGNNLWWEAICKEMKHIRPAFEVFKGKQHDLPPGFQQIRCHMIFDIKIGEDFHQKARFVAGGHTTETPASLTYSSVVSRDTIRIALTIAALNDLQVMSCDIHNAYLTAACREKIWTYAGPEFGSEKGSIMLICKALYGLKSSGTAFLAHLANTLHDNGFISSKSDPDMWLHPAVKPDGEEYYEYILYVDNILAISHKATQVLEDIQDVFKLKNDKIAPPRVQLEKMTVGTHDGWALSSDKYIKAALDTVEKSLADTGKRLPSKCKTPISSGYRPELDTTPELNAEGLQKYQEMIGMLRWAVELGHVDVLLETAMMSTHLALPRIGHLEQVYHIFGYLKGASKQCIFLDPQHLDVDERSFTKYDWTDFYRDADERVPSDMPLPRDRAVSTHCFVDSDHAGDKVTRRSQTGLLLLVNHAPVVWYSKRQNTVETSTFGSEFITMKTAVEQIEALWYKLRMFGIPIEGSTNVFCDNEAVFKNTTMPDSTLKKKHTSICYHRCREVVASKTIRLAKEGTLTNLSDLFTKPLPQVTREGLLDQFTY